MAVIAKLHQPKRPRRRSRRLKSLALLPTLLTLGNLVCGFAAVYYALRAMYELGGGVPAGAPTGLTAFFERKSLSFVEVAAGLIILGGICDALDGMMARVTRSTTDFGGQLDSMADVITFGVAPATLIVVLMFRHLAGEELHPSPISEHFIGRAAWLAAAVYVAFSAMRLARYNVEHAKPEFDHRAFRGLPIPGAAFMIVALIIFQEQPYGDVTRAIVVFALPIVALTSALLMVSRIPYKRFQRTFLLGRKPFGQFLGFVAIIAVFWLYKAPMAVILVAWYWSSGPVGFMITTLRRQHAPAVATAPKVGESVREQS